MTNFSTINFKITYFYKKILTNLIKLSPLNWNKGYILCDTTHLFVLLSLDHFFSWDSLFTKKMPIPLAKSQKNVKDQYHKIIYRNYGSHDFFYIKIEKVNSDLWIDTTTHLTWYAMWSIIQLLSSYEVDIESCQPKSGWFPKG